MKKNLRLGGKRKEEYLYDGENEIGAFISPENPKNLRVLGLEQNQGNPNTIALELDNKIYAPFLDVSRKYSSFSGF